LRSLIVDIQSAIDQIGFAFYETQRFDSEELRSAPMLKTPHIRLQHVKATSLLLILVLALTIVNKTSLNINQKEIIASQTCNTLTINLIPSNGGTTNRNPQASCSLSQVLTESPNYTVQSISSLPANIGSGPGLSRANSVVETFITLISKAEAEGTVRVIVGLQASFEPEGYLDGPQAVISQRGGIRRAQDDMVNRLPTVNAQSIKRFQTIPYIAMEVDAAGLRYLQSSPDVTSIEEDVAVPPSLAESLAIVGAPAAWASGYSGAGQTIAILDSGVDKNHPFLAGKVVSEACFSTNGTISSSVCPGGVSQSTSAGSGLHCPSSVDGCDHGTHVAGIAAGRGTTFSGVAKDANIIAIQVFSRFNNQTNCGDNPTPCALTFASDQVFGLERVLALTSSFNIAAVNMSLGGGQFFSYCDAQQSSRKGAIDNLRSRGIPTIISSGNNGFTDSMQSPACISSAISVGATGDGSRGTIRDRVRDSSNSASFLNMLAPGAWINSSLPGGVFDNFSGTSMAAPHVAGAWAVLKSKVPSATFDQVLSALTSTGVPITDSRNGIIKPRLQLDAALNALNEGGGGGNTAQYGSGTTTTITATPNEGFAFVKWQRDSVDYSISPTVDVVMNANYTMTAIFRSTASNSPTISSASFQSPKTMRIFGTRFGQFPRVFVNGLEKTSFISSVSDTSITLKGKSKKIGLKSGLNNVLVVTASGSGSNIYVMTL
jgi:subtilisin